MPSKAVIITAEIRCSNHINNSIRVGLKAAVEEAVVYSEEVSQGVAEARTKGTGSSSSTEWAGMINNIQIKDRGQAIGGRTTAIVMGVMIAMMMRRGNVGGRGDNRGCNKGKARGRDKEGTSNTKNIISSKEEAGMGKDMEEAVAWVRAAEEVQEVEGIKGPVDPEVVSILLACTLPECSSEAEEEVVEAEEEEVEVEEEEAVEVDIIVDRYANPDGGSR